MKEKCCKSSKSQQSRESRDVAHVRAIIVTVKVEKRSNTKGRKKYDNKIKQWPPVTGRVLVTHQSCSHEVE